MIGPIELAERGTIPDWALRWGIRRLLRARLRSLSGTPIQCRNVLDEFAEQLRQSPLAVETEAANAQHYEVPAEFFQIALGRHLKYSSGYWQRKHDSLDDAEAAMLSLTCERAQVADGMELLDLGCGWGSLSLWLAESYPNAHVTAVSNSHSQREFIEHTASHRRLSNLRVITADIRDFEIAARFDRVLAIEMFEHLRNYELLFARIASWLKPAGKLFAHIFCHRESAYLFETTGDENWMGRHFFAGGMMPADSLLGYFQKDLLLERQWRVAGTHYQRTAEAWLARLNRNRAAALQLFAAAADGEAALRVQRWRMFFMAVAELFGYNRGQEWWVSHYRFVKR